MKNLLDSFNNKKIMIVGDIMLDIYMKGKVERISPEAPVPIVSVTDTFSRLGGAANVAQNLKALGAEPVLCSIIGDDEDSTELMNLLLEQEMTPEGIIKSKERRTTTKTRVIGNNAQMIRIDKEDTFDLTEDEYNKLALKITEIIEKENIDGVILQDYNKGILTENLINHVITLSNKKGIAVCVDPKKKNFLAYKNVTLFKPNLKELMEGTQATTYDSSIDGIFQTIDTLQKTLNATYIMTTLSERGVVIKDYKHNARHHIPAHLRKIADVSGAGDTVLSVAMLCLVSGFDAYHIAALSNLAGGLACEELGAAPINKDRFFEEIRKIYYKE